MWLKKKKQEGLRRFWSMFLLTRVPFWYRFFEPQPCGNNTLYKSCGWSWLLLACALWWIDFDPYAYGVVLVVAPFSHPIVAYFNRTIPTEALHKRLSPRPSNGSQRKCSRRPSPMTPPAPKKKTTRHGYCQPLHDQIERIHDKTSREVS